MNDVGRMLIYGGLAIALLGLLVAGLAPLGLGRLPGDLNFRWGNVTVFAPLMTCLVLSVLLTLGSWFLRGR